MPIFEFACDECHALTETICSGSTLSVTCGKCGSERTRRVMSLSNFGGAGIRSSAAGHQCSGGSCSTCSTKCGH